MTLEELADTLPNGFHDAEVQTLALDFPRRLALFEMRVWVGSMDSAAGGERERYRSARITLAGLAYCAIDPPDPRYPYPDGQPVNVDLSAEVANYPLVTNSAPDTFASRFFVSGWNSFIHVAAASASLEWIPELPRPHAVP